MGGYKIKDETSGFRISVLIMVLGVCVGGLAITGALGFIAFHVQDYS